MFEFIALLGYVLAVSVAAIVVRRGAERKSPRVIVVGVLLGVLLAASVSGGLWYLDFWGEKRWFDALGYGERFMRVFGLRWTLAAGGALVSAGIAWLIARVARAPKLFQLVAVLLAGFSGGSSAMVHWDEVLLFQNAVSTGVVDPVLGRDVAFYLFELPLLRSLHWPLLGALVLGASAAALTLVLRLGASALPPQIARLLPESARVRFIGRPAAPVRALLLSGALFLFLLAFRTYLGRFEYVIVGTGASSGAGYTDVFFRMPMQAVMAGLLAVAGLVVLGVAVTRRGDATPIGIFARLAWLPIGLLGAWIILLGVVPWFPQRFKVTPNELAVERPFIEHGMHFTRQAFGIGDVVERTLAFTDTMNPRLAEQNAALLQEIPLWDYRALLQVHSQFQEIRLYYDFQDVDIDRYRIGGELKQVMVSAREMNQEALPEQSQTFINKRFRYTHGHGIVASTVSDFTADGQPRYLVRDIPARSTVPELAVDRPEIYFGELTREHVYVGTTEPEFDYPDGQSNAETFYEGEAGVPLGSFWAKLVYAKRFGETRLLFADHLTPESRVLFRRQVQERVKALAPFLLLDSDPYIVVDQGRLFWIIDAYTWSRNYPYSEHVGSGDLNYIRNSVKVVVDAYHGSVDFYLYDEDDPLAQAWSRAFPGMFQSAESMPEGLREHVRYPELLLELQGQVYTRYHMTNAQTFYNNEDLWELAREKYYGQDQQVEPYYILWNEPDSDGLEFIQMLPFTPRRKQVMSGWLAGEADGEHYGRLVAYRLPKDRQVLGPLQFEAKIDQDEDLSQLMTLWGSGGSRVIRGHVLSIPIGNTVLHVEPIYLEAETSSFPELQLVAVMQGDQMGYGRSLEEALQSLFERNGSGPAAALKARQSGASEGMSVRDLATRASGSFEAYLRLQAEGRFEEAGRELTRMRQYLQQLVDTP